MPELHVIATCSLLEFALEELPSYGVGRIRSQFMYPMSFDEYLNAMNLSALANKISMSRGAMQSLYQFMTEKDVKKGVRVSLENFGKIDDVEIYPIYATSKIL